VKIIAVCLALQGCAWPHLSASVGGLPGSVPVSRAEELADLERLQPVIYLKWEF
jgi:hypothetical protein